MTEQEINIVVGALLHLSLIHIFYKGKNSSGSSVGIGLALARMIVVAQEGTLSATNRINGGAKFEIRFYKGTV